MADSKKTVVVYTAPKAQCAEGIAGETAPVGYAAVPLTIPLALETAPLVGAGLLLGAVAYGEYQTWVDLINLTTRGHLQGEGGFELDDSDWDGVSPRGTIEQSLEGERADTWEAWQHLIDLGLVRGPGQVGLHQPGTEASGLSRRADVDAWQKLTGTGKYWDQSQGQGERTDTPVGSLPGVAGWLGRLVSKMSGLDVDINGNIVDPDVVDVQTGERWDGGTIAGPADRGITDEKLAELIRELSTGSGYRGSWQPPNNGKKPTGGKASSVLLGILAGTSSEGGNGQGEVVGQDANGNDIVMMEDEDGTKHYFVFNKDGSFTEVNEDGTPLGSGGETGEGEQGGDVGLSPDAFDWNANNPDKDADGSSEAIEEAGQEFGTKLGQENWYENENLVFELWNMGQSGDAGWNDGRTYGDAGLGDSFGASVGQYGGYGSDPGSTSHAGGAPLVGGGSEFDTGAGGFSEGVRGSTPDDSNFGIVDAFDPTGLETQDELHGRLETLGLDFKGSFTWDSSGKGVWISTNPDGSIHNFGECADGCVCHCAYLPTYSDCPDHCDDPWPGVTREWVDGTHYQDICNNCGCVSSAGRVISVS